MKFLLTGGAGYLGSILTELLLARGHAVTVLDDFSRSRTSLLHLSRAPDLRVVRGDAGNIPLLRELVAKADVLVPLAGVVGQSACDEDPGRATRVNRDAVVELLLARERAGSPSAQRVVFPATNSGYGTKTGQVACDESTPLTPISHYGRTKVAAEDALLSCENAYSLRFATLFGPSPAMRWDLLVNYFVRESLERRYLVLFEAGFKRNYLHVQDAARSILHVAELPDSGAGAPRHRVYNVGLPMAYTKGELAQIVARSLADSQPPRQVYVHEAPVGADPDKRNYEVSVARIRASGFQPTWTLEEGIAQVVRAAAGALA